MSHALAGGYHGPPDLTAVRALTEWTLDAWMVALVLLLGGCYLAGVRHLRRRGEPWPGWRTVNFAGLGLGIAVIATMSSFGTYYGVLFYMRAFQTILLLLLAPLFLALGRPLTLAITVFPSAGRRIDRAIHSRGARVVTFPAITTLALVAVPFVMYFTTWYTAAFHSVAVRELTHLALMVPGFVFFWTLLRVGPVPKTYSYGVSLWITAVEVVGDAFLGLAVIAYTSLIGAGYYHALARPWGPSLQTDQILGGGRCGSSVIWSACRSWWPSSSSSCGRTRPRRPLSTPNWTRVTPRGRHSQGRHSQGRHSQGRHREADPTLHRSQEPPARTIRTAPGGRTTSASTTDSGRSDAGCAASGRVGPLSRRPGNGSAPN